MRIISKKKILDFSREHSESKSSLENWYRVVNKSEFSNFAELRRAFSSADQVDGMTVFNVAGNKYRLIAAIHYNRRIVFVRDILTHVEYDKNKWRKA